METIGAFDSQFIPSDLSGYQLLLQVSSSSLSYAVFDKNDKTFKGLKLYLLDNDNQSEIKQSIQNILAEDPMLLLNYTDVRIQYESFRAMLVPASLFDSKNLKSFLKFHHDVDDKDQIYFVESRSAEAFVIFSIPLYIEETIGKLYANVCYAHHSVPFINKAIKNDSLEVVPCLHIHFSNNFFDILIIRNGKIQLCNSFFYKKHSDVIYFISNILNLFSLTPDIIKVILSGEIEASSDVLSEMQKIFKNMQFEQYDYEYKYSGAMMALPQHKFVNLLNLVNCE